MCTDYTDLNKACPKDAYPLPSIDRLVDGAAGHRRLSFLDAFQAIIDTHVRPRCGQDDFHHESSNYCYQVMLFGLKKQRPLTRG